MLSLTLDYSGRRGVLELEIYDALQSAGVSAEKAKAAVESINKAIDQRYAIHAAQLATRGNVELAKAEVEKVRADLARTESNLIKWLVATAFIIIGTNAALITRLPL